MSVAAQRVLMVGFDGRVLRERADRLLSDGYEVEVALDGRTACERLADCGPDTCVLCSVTAPGAVLLLRALRAGEIPGASAKLPVLVIGGTDDERTLLLCCAVEVDFVVPSWSSPLLLAAALKAVERRRGRERKTLLVANVVIDRETHSVKVDDEPIHLTPIEFEMLEALALQPGCAIAHDALTRSLWREDADSVASLCRLRVHVARLRRKLQEADAAVTVKAVYSIGFVLTANER